MIRLDKVLAHLGYGSRKEVKEMIKKGLIKVDGILIKNSDLKINEDSEIEIADDEVKYNEFKYYVINKPSGYLSATESNNYPCVIDLVPYHKGLFPVGRLDLDTEGLLIITNDGQLAHNLLSPKKEVEKEYYFKYKGKLNDDSVEMCLKGLNINNEYVTKEAILNIINDTEGKIIIKEGKYHEVKRMIKTLGGEVTYLKRIRMKELELGDLKIGEYRELDVEEIKKLKKWKIGIYK